MSDEAKAQYKLKSGLVRLQKQGAVVLKDERQVRMKLYKHLAEAYLWWRDATSEGYIDEAYATLNRRIRKVKYGINFNPLFWLIWGNNTERTNQDSDRYSRVLNGVHAEFESKPEYYAKDTVAKLSNFMNQPGGIGKIGPYGSDESDVEDDAYGATSTDNAAKPDAKAIESELLKLTTYLDEYGKKKVIPFDGYLKGDFKRYGLLLVERTEDGLNIIDTYKNPALLNSMLADHLRRSFEVTVFALRPLVELIQTQCLPKHLEGLVDRLVDKARLPDEGRAKFVAHRRIMFRPSSNEFVLSPMNALSGVVSIVEPFFQLILEGCEKDIYLSPDDRALLESKLLRDFEFNLYDVLVNNASIPHYEVPDSASHVVHLRHRADPSEFFSLVFWPFYDTLPGPQDQVLFDTGYEFSAKWYAHMERDAFQKLNDEFLEEWLNGFGKHLTRPYNALMRITFSHDAWRIEFVNRDGLFENDVSVSLPSIQSSAKPITAYFATKDLIPALRSLSLLPVTDVASTESWDDEDEADDDEETFIYGARLTEFVPEEAASYKGAVELELDDN